MDIQFFLHISKTYHPIFTFDNSIRRSSLVLYFILFDLRALANVGGRYSSKTVFLILFGIYFFSLQSNQKQCLHHAIALLKSYIFCSGC